MQRVVALILVLIVATWCQADPIGEIVTKRLAMGDKPNRLVHEKSPYLLQHAFNPVDWYPWGDEAFERARKENKPIFLSVGYSTCHWCHVMEEESFEHPKIAAILNRWFICIKVDREERPDIDQLYMAATQAMSGTGGWPMSVFLFPDGKPFYAGTYFPPEAKYGRPGFTDVLLAIHEAWETKRGGLAEVAGQIIEGLANQEKRSIATGIDKNILQKAYEEFANHYEPSYGGFGDAPKFPRPVALNYLLGYWYRTGEEHARVMVLTTLHHMAAGGMYDHLGGGFHRYSTDKEWLVPHFEKMLYDQAQLAITYIDAFIITGEAFYADVAAGVLDYVRHVMTGPEGGFYSAEDADSEDPYTPGKKKEGAFYLWREDEVRRVLDANDYPLFAYSYGVLDTGNVKHDPLGEFTGMNILYRARSLGDAVKQFKLPVDKVDSSLTRSRAALKARQVVRTRPHLDDKVLTGWNGLMMAAFARAGMVLDKPEYIDVARKAAAFLRDAMLDSSTAKLSRRHRQGETGLAGQLDDYAFLVYGLTELYQAVQEPEWLALAVRLTARQIDLFWDKDAGGFFDSIEDTSLPVRMKGDYDGAEPSGNSVAAWNLLVLGTLTDNKDWLAKAAKTIETFGTRINRMPGAMPAMLQGLQFSLTKPRQVVIAGKRDDNGVSEMIQTAYRHYSPGRLILLADDGVNQEHLASYMPFITDMSMIDNKATAYVCQDFSCKMPVTDTDSLHQQLEQD